MNHTPRSSVSAYGCALAMLVLAAMAQMAAGQTPLTQPSSAGEYQIYPLKHGTAEELERLLSTTLPELGETAHVVADAKKKLILLQGSPRAQQLARQLIASFDKPKPSPSPLLGADASPVLRLYPVAPDVRQAMVARLRAHFPDENTVRIAGEPRGQQLIVLAPAELHEQIADLLGPARGTAAPAQGSSGPPSLLAGQTTSVASARQPAVSDFVVRLVHGPTDQMETSLLKILGARLEPQRVDRERGHSLYRLRNSHGGWTDLSLNHLDNFITVRGESELARQMVRLVQALDDPQLSLGRATRIVPFRTADPLKVKEALDAYRGHALPTAGSRPPPQPTMSSGVPADDVGPVPDPQSSHRYESGIALVAYIFQQPEGSSNAAASKPSEAEGVTDRQLRELGIEVDVETLPDLDIVILRGRDRDVEELAKIIEELERLSVEAEPQIEVYPLRHVKGGALVPLLTQATPALVGSRQGRVSITSLEKPNALLLIGWGEALAAMKDLIRKLDQPVSPDTQLQVFRLKHAPATQTSQTITQFFSNRQGLGPKLTVEADARTNALIIQASPRDLAEVTLLIERLDTTQSGAVNQARVFRIRNALAEDLADTLRNAIQAARGGTAAQRSAVLEFLTMGAEGQRQLQSGLLTDVQFTPDARNNTILVTAPAESMELLAALIEQLDSPASVAQIKVFRITNGDATDLVTMFRSLFPTETGASQGPSLAGAEGETALVPLRFSVDSRSNSIIATGSEGDLKIIEALLLRLDEQGLEERQNQVYRLKNAPAQTVATAINEFLRSERILEQVAPGTTSPFQRIQREVVVVPEIISNSLILSATSRFFAEISKLIEELDKEPPQVMIQVLIAEVDLTNTDEFGVELGLQDSVLFDRSLLGNLLTTKQTATTGGGQVIATEDVVQSATNEPGFAFNSTPLPGLPNSGSSKSLADSDIIGGQGLSNFAVGRVNSELGFGGLVLSASSESVSILIRALQDSRRLDILSRPQIRTLDNQPAFIQIGERVPRITQSTVTVGGNITNSVVLEEVGLIVGVTPRISPDGLVVMEVDAEKSELGPEAEGIPISVTQEGGIIRAPRVKTTTAMATVSAADGETIVLGGLISKSTVNVSRRVPYLSDIPLLGQLFRYDGVIGKKKELLIIMTPYVIDSPEDNERIKQLETARMSWCCADVHAIHGVSGLCNEMDCPVCQAEVPVVYPDFDPRGLRIGEPLRQNNGEENREQVPIPATTPPDVTPPMNESRNIAPIPLNSRTAWPIPGSSPWPYDAVDRRGQGQPVSLPIGDTPPPGQAEPVRMVRLPLSPGMEMPR